MNVPMLDLKLEYNYMKKDIDVAIAGCLDHQRWIFGPEVKDLEDSVAKYIGVKHCIGVSSGTEALVLSLRALAIKLKGKEYFDKCDEIITTPFTFTATGDAILRSGATPVFVDIDLVTYNISAKLVKKYLDCASGRVVGIIPVHLYGQSCDMDGILELAKEHKLFVVEDVAQSFGGGWKNKKLGAIGITGCFSFFPSKNLGGFGDGGMVSTDSDEVSDMVRMLIKHGGKDKYNVDHIGYNARLDTIQAGILLAKYRYINEFNAKRAKVASQYDIKLKGVSGIKVPSSQANAQHVFHQYTIRVDGGRRDGLQKFMRGKGIDTMIYYPIPLHKMKVFDNRSKIAGTLSESERAAEEVLSLPMEPLQGDEATSYVANTVRSYFEKE